MTELSAAARAVLAAVTQSQYCLEPEDVPNEAARIACEAAAALRAAANQLISTKAMLQLQAIADELDAQ